MTFFFNGGRETPYDAEERILVPSPKVATYDLKPEMSAYEVKDKLVEAINTKKFDFIVVNYANGDMVGHTGIYEAIEKAVKAIDECVKDTVEAAKANDYEVIIIADHGNADHALNEDFNVDEAVRSHIKFLRRKLASSGKEYIQTVWGIGYRFAP